MSGSKIAIAQILTSSLEKKSSADHKFYFCLHSDIPIKFSIFLSLPGKTNLQLVFLHDSLTIMKMIPISLVEI